MKKFFNTDCQNIVFILWIVLLSVLLILSAVNYTAIANQDSTHTAKEITSEINLPQSCQSVEIDSIYAKILPDEKPCKITLSGKPYECDSPYYTDIRIEVFTSPKIVLAPRQDSGYSPVIAPFNFLGKDYEQIFFASSTGGSGGFGNYYVYDFSQRKTNTLFDSENIPNIFSAQYGDNYTAQISKLGKPFFAYDLSQRKDLADMWDNDGKFIGEGSPDVSAINFVEPTYIYSMKRYRLNLWQKVTLGYQADVAGYIITTVDLKDNYNFVSVWSDSPPMCMSNNQ